LVAQSPPPAVPDGFPILLPATGFAPGGGELASEKVSR